MAFPSCCSRQQSPREAPCPSQVTPLSNNEWAVRYPAAGTTWSSPSWTPFHCSSYALQGCSFSWMDYISTAFSSHRRWVELTLKRKVFWKLACDLLSFLICKKTVWNISPPLTFLTAQSHRACPSCWQDPDWVGGNAHPLHQTLTHGMLFWCQRNVNSIPINFFPLCVGVVSQFTTGPGLLQVDGVTPSCPFWQARALNETLIK